MEIWLMPKLDKIINARDSKKFTKKSYRPWDLTGDGNSTSNQEFNTVEALDSSSSNLEKNISLIPNLGIILDNNKDNNKITKEYQQEINKINGRRTIRTQTGNN